jgi:hypothetical protein
MTIQEKSREMLKLLDILDLWKVAQEVGYSSDEVKAFSFRDKFLTAEESKLNYYSDGVWHRKLSGETHHNCVRLVSGELKQIPLTERPKKV